MHKFVLSQTSDFTSSSTVTYLAFLWPLCSASAWLSLWLSLYCCQRILRWHTNGGRQFDFIQELTDWVLMVVYVVQLTREWNTRHGKFHCRVLVFTCGLIWSKFGMYNCHVNTEVKEAGNMSDNSLHCWPLKNENPSLDLKTVDSVHTCWPSSYQDWLLSLNRQTKMKAKGHSPLWCKGSITLRNLLSTVCGLHCRSCWVTDCLSVHIPRDYRAVRTYRPWMRGRNGIVEQCIIGAWCCWL